MFRRLFDKLTARDDEDVIILPSTPPPLPADVSADLAPLPATAIQVEWESCLTPTPTPNEAPRRRTATPLNTAALEYLMRTPDRRIDIAQAAR